MSGGPQHLLSMAGVNLAAILDDTSDLSTIRGSGLLLLDAVQRTEDELKSLAPGAETISRGASEGLFLLPAGVNAEDVRDRLDQGLKGDTELQHATFVVDVEAMAGNGDFKRAKEVVKARNRWRQMQAPSLAIPRPTGLAPCQDCAVRPAAVGKQSASVARLLPPAEN